MYSRTVAEGELQDRWRREAHGRARALGGTLVERDGHLLLQRGGAAALTVLTTGVANRWFEAWAALGAMAEPAAAARPSA